MRRTKNMQDLNNKTEYYLIEIKTFHGWDNLHWNLIINLHVFTMNLHYFRLFTIKPNVISLQTFSPKETLFFQYFYPGYLNTFILSFLQILKFSIYLLSTLFLSTNILSWLIVVSLQLTRYSQDKYTENRDFSHQFWNGAWALEVGI